MNTPRVDHNKHHHHHKAIPNLRLHSNLQATRVAKRIAPSQPGAIKLAEQYGERLVCVRYRHDPTGRHRYTTVELVVARSLVKPRSERQQRPKKLQVVALRLGGTENELRKVVLAHGGVWNSKARLWYSRPHDCTSTRAAQPRRVTLSSNDHDFQQLVPVYRQLLRRVGVVGGSTSR